MLRTKRKTQDIIQFITIISIWVLLFICCSCQGKRRSDVSPNVILLIIDTLRADHLSCNGYKLKTTPNIDAIAGKAVVFENAFCQIPQTLPSFCSILTGQYPFEHGVRANGFFYLGEESQTMAEILREKNYQTAAFISAFPLDSRFGIDQGFDFYEERMVDKRPMAGLLPTKDGGLNWLGHKTDCFETTADHTTKRAIGWIKKSKKKTFFLLVHYFDPHHDYVPPDEFKQMFDHPYDGEIAFVDQQIGVLLNCLEDLRLLDKSILVITADHGECLGEYGRVYHWAHLVDAAVHIPLIFYFPKVLPKGEIYNNSVQSIDILPTILSLLDIPRPKMISGRNLTPIFKGQDMAQEYVYLETSKGEVPKEAYGIRTERWKFIMRRNSNVEEKKASMELFDLLTDPDELNNKSNLYPHIIAELKGHIRKLIGKGGGHKMKNLYSPDKETREKLNSLGYISR